jgi:hypothetical protein
MKRGGITGSEEGCGWEYGVRPAPPPSSQFPSLLRRRCERQWGWKGIKAIRRRKKKGRKAARLFWSFFICVYACLYVRLWRLVKECKCLYLCVFVCLVADVCVPPACVKGMRERVEVRGRFFFVVVDLVQFVFLCFMYFLFS